MKIKKTFKDISKQMERIWSLYYNGYGTDKMFQMCENFFMKLLAKYEY